MEDSFEGITSVEYFNQGVEPTLIWADVLTAEPEDGVVFYQIDEPWCNVYSYIVVPR